MRKLFAAFLLVAVAVPGRADIKVWEHDYLQAMSRSASITSGVDTILSCRVTPGEYEPLAFAVRPDAASQVSVSLVSGSSPSDLPQEWIELFEVRSLNPTSTPNRLYPISGPVVLPGGQTNYFWITLHPDSKAQAGTYKGQVLVTSGGSQNVLALECEVLPFRLEESPVTGGVFMAAIDLPASWYLDMKEHGMDAIQFFWFGGGAIVAKNVGGKLAHDYTVLDRVMGNLMAAGMKGPVIPSLGNDNTLSYEIQLAGAFGIPVDTSEIIDGKRITGPAVSPALDSLLVEGLGQIRDYWSLMHYPELVVLIYDEPTERLLDRHKNRYDLLKTVMPDTRVYGVVMNRREWAESMTNQCDIIVANGSFTGCREVTQAYHKDYWIYSAPLSSLLSSRFNMGFRTWSVQAQGTFFWMYNYWTYDPDGCAVYQDPGNSENLIRSTAWECIREAMDDLRYLATAEAMIGRARGEDRSGAEGKLDLVRQAVNPNTVLSSAQFQELRGKLIGIVLDLIAAGVPTSDKTCDFNGDGKVSILDLVSFLALARMNPRDPRLDWDEDGKYSIFDLIRFLHDLTKGTCPGQAILQSNLLGEGL